MNSSSLEKIEDAAKVILEAIGEDLERDGLIDTPARVARMFIEMTSGLREEPPKLTTFPRGDNDQMVVVRKLLFNSLCEHHLLPFIGEVNIGYIPRDRLVGLSKFGRIVDYYARRPQIQEQMTAQIAKHLVDMLEPIGLIVMCSAEHLCMSCRGVRKPGHKTVTSAIRGSIVREEFFELLKQG